MHTLWRNKILNILLLVVCFSVSSVSSQQLEAKVELISQKITGVDKSIFSNLQQSLTELLNSTNWTNESSEVKSRIPCSFILTIESKTEENTYQASLQIQAKRPVFSSDYFTPLLNHKDKQLRFSFMPNEPLQYSASRNNNNLVATLAFYAYLIIGLDGDSFVKNGGTGAFKEAQRIVNTQNKGESEGGWAMVEDKINRYRIIEDLLTYKELRESFYRYHREGLDKMVGSPEKALENLVDSVYNLEEVYKTANSTTPLHLFFDTKALEIVESCSVLKDNKRAKLHKLLTQIAPGHLGIFKSLE